MDRGGHTLFLRMLSDNILRWRNFLTLMEKFFIQKVLTGYSNFHLYKS